MHESSHETMKHQMKWILAGSVVASVATAYPDRDDGGLNHAIRSKWCAQIFSPGGGGSFSLIQ